MATDRDFIQRLGGGGLLTTEILYYLPDHRSLLQSFVWQTIDTAPRCPRPMTMPLGWGRPRSAPSRGAGRSTDRPVNEVLPCRGQLLAARKGDIKTPALFCPRSCRSGQ